MTAVLDIADPPALQAFADFCSELTLSSGKRMVLEPFQRRGLRDYFNGATETLQIIPKKNGKSTLIGALAIHHMLTVPNARVLIVASVEKQGDELFEAAAGFIANHDSLRDTFHVIYGRKEITLKDYDEDGNVTAYSRLKILSGKPSSADGSLATLSIVEEWHRHKDGGELYSILRKGVTGGDRKGQLICITTAGDDDTSPLGLMRNKMYELPIQERELGGTYRYCANADRSVVMHEWALTPDHDWQDAVVVKLANPASWHTVEKLQAEIDSPSTREWYWKRYTCGLWVRGEGAAIQASEWDALYDERATIPKGAGVVIGFDLAFKTDCTALAPIYWESGERRVAGTPIILSPPDAVDRSIDDRAITWAFEYIIGARKWDEDAFVAELADRNDADDLARWAHAISSAQQHNVSVVVLDPNRGAEQLAQQLERAHPQLTWQPFNQTPTDLVRADGRLTEAIRNGWLVHNGHKGLRYHALNAVERRLPRGDTYFHKAQRGPHTGKPIDALRALSMAHDVAVGNGGTGPIKKKKARYGIRAW